MFYLEFWIQNSFDRVPNAVNLRVAPAQRVAII